MILKLGVQYRRFEVNTVYTNDDPGMTLTYFTARTNILLKNSFESPKFCHIFKLYFSKYGFETHLHDIFFKFFLLVFK